MPIPKQIFMYWDTSPMSLLNYLSFYTIRKLNPSYNIILYRPSYPYTGPRTWKSIEHEDRYTRIDYLEDVLKLDIKIVYIDFSDIDFHNDVPETFKSDYVRMYLLDKYGGIWLDSDMICLQPLDNIDMPVDTNIVMIKDKHVPQYFMMATPDNVFFKILLGLVKTKFNIESYQSIGTELLDAAFRSNDVNSLVNIHYIALNEFAPYKWHETNKLFYGDDDMLVNNDTKAMHLFNGSKPTITYANSIDHMNFPTRNDQFMKIVSKVITHDEITNISKLRKISIVMGYYNRKEQLEFTLRTIKMSSYANYEIIIVDDASDNDNRLDSIVDKYNFKLIRIEPQDKTWLNPCMAYNIGIRAATGDIIVLQNPEVCHIGDILDDIVCNIRPNEYLTYNCYGMANRDRNLDIYQAYQSLDDIKQIHQMVSLMPKKIGGNSAFNNDIGGWLNHHNYHFTAYHYLSAINRSDLIKIGFGFCEKYKDGINLDDIDFVKQIIYAGIKLKIHSFDCNTNPFCIHQWHPKPKQLSDNPVKYHNINKVVFNQRMKDIGANNIVDIHAGFNMPAPVIY